MAVSDHTGLSILPETIHSGLSAETGLSVFARLCSRPSLDDVLQDLLPSPFPQVTQVTWTGNLGESNAVTSFLVDLIVTTVLPKSQKGVSIGGCGAGVILINTDHHIKVRSIAKHMEERVKNVADLHYRKLPRGERSRENRLTSSDQWEIVKSSLERIHIMEVFTPNSLDISIISISNILSGNTNVSCVIIDSISAFYYQVRATSNVNYNNYVKRILGSINSSIKLPNSSVKLIYSIHQYFNQGKQEIGYKDALITVGCVEEEETVLSEVGEALGFVEKEERVYSAVGEVGDRKMEKKFSVDALGNLKWKS